MEELNFKKWMGKTCKTCTGEKMARVIMKRTVFDGQTYYIAHQNNIPIGKAAQDLARKIKKAEKKKKLEEEEKKKLDEEVKTIQFLESVKTDAADLKFQIGQKVRVKKQASHNCDTPSFWEESTCEVLAAMTSQMLEDNFYMLAHINGAVDTFREDELDLRFSKKNKSDD